MLLGVLSVARGTKQGQYWEQLLSIYQSRLAVIVEINNAWHQTGINPRSYITSQN